MEETWIQTLINNNITSMLVGGGITLISWFGYKRYIQKREIKAKDIENEGSTSNVVGQNLELYQRMLDDYTERKDKELNEAYQRIEKLNLRVEFLEEENRKLRIKISDK